MEVIVTAKAARDLEEWLSRIEADNPAAAEAFRARIRHWIEVIREHPQVSGARGFIYAAQRLCLEC